MDTEQTETKVGTPMFLGHYKGVNIHQFAKDLLLFGSSRAMEICDSYKISGAVFVEISELPAFKKEIRELRALIEASPNALLQLKARTIMERGLEELEHIIHTGEKDTDRIKAMELISKIAGVGLGGKASESENMPQASGLVLNVNIGPTGLIPAKQPRRPLRKVDEIRQAIEVQGV